MAELLGLPLAQTVKSLVLATDERNAAGDIVATTVWLLLVRGDHELNEVKAGKIEGLRGGFRFATVTEIDRNHLFYLMARGIDEKTARGLLVKAFLAEVIEELENEPVVEALEARLEDWFATHG